MRLLACSHPAALYAAWSVEIARASVPDLFGVTAGRPDPAATRRRIVLRPPARPVADRDHGEPLARALAAIREDLGG
jgi:hypothetical protein